MKIVKAVNYNDMARKAANVVSAHVILNPACVLGLATGSTPVGTYSQLIDWYNKGDVDFEKVHSVNLDEYVGLKPENDQSYAYYMYHNFFKCINIKPENTNIPNGMAPDLEEECRRYDAVIESLGGIDLQILGIGHNGHIGFNEPDTEFEKQTHCVTLDERTIEANSRFFADKNEVPRKALTMGIKSIMNAKNILLMANGSAKAEIMEKALFGPITPQVPASILQLHPNLTVVADEAALSVVCQNHPALFRR